jgi:Predicted hydrolase (HAD superfamily)
MVGNDYYKDIEPAKSVGMRTIFFTEKKETDNFQSADYLINRMEELNNVICKLTKG